MTRKICILSSIAYKGYVPYSSIYHYGITKVTPEIFADVKNNGYTLKFIAESRLIGGKVKVSVEPSQCGFLNVIALEPVPDEHEHHH
jgi:homoserine dehydrogenase